MLAYTAAFVIAFASALCLAPLVRKVAIALGLVDHPNLDRKLHGRATPLGGGVAVFLAALAGTAVVTLVPGEVSVSLREARSDLWALLLSATVICAVGVVDDRHALRGRQKLLGQLAAASILVYSGLVIRNIYLFDTAIDLGLLAVPLTLFWLLGAMNALNLLDGADGVATTAGLIISGVIAAMAGLMGNMAEAALAMALTGALCGFLPLNFPPARVFLGDGGSMFLGLTVGVLAIRGARTGPATVALAAPLAVLAIPVLDTVAAVVRRSLTGRGIYATDRGHLHHMLLRRGMGPRGMLAGIAALCAVTGAGALGSVATQRETWALAGCAFVVAVLVASRLFGFHELVLVATRTLAFASSLVTFTSTNRELIRQESVHVQGSRDWDRLWSVLTDFAERHELSKVSLDLNVSWLHEGYHAVWQRNAKRERWDTWLTRVPLAVAGRTVGLLEVSGPLHHGATHQLLTMVAELLESMEPDIERLAEALPEDDLDSARGQETGVVDRRVSAGLSSIHEQEEPRPV